MSSRNLQATRIPHPSGRVSLTEGQHRHRRRLSESAPPRHTTPPPRETGGTDSPRSVPPVAKRPALAVVPDIATRRCTKCRTDRPDDAFVLLDASEQTFGAVRRWCDTCVSRSAFAKHKAFKTGLVIRDEARAAAHADAFAAAAAEHTRASNALALSMYDRAAADPVFAAALRLAASALDFPRADLEAVI